MRPPLCAVCNAEPERETGSGKPLQEFIWVTFADYKPLADENFGHPEGVEWFCPQHAAAAEARSTLTSHKALQEIRSTEV